MRWLAFSLTAVLAATLIAAPTQAAVIAPPPRSEERPVPIEAAQTGRKVLTASRFLRGNQPAMMQATSGDPGVVSSCSAAAKGDGKTTDHGIWMVPVSTPPAEDLRPDTSQPMAG